MAEKTRYSDAELEEFRAIIMEKLELKPAITSASIRYPLVVIVLTNDSPCSRQISLIYNEIGLTTSLKYISGSPPNQSKCKLKMGYVFMI